MAWIMCFSGMGPNILEKTSMKSYPYRICWKGFPAQSKLAGQERIHTGQSKPARQEGFHTAQSKVAHQEKRHANKGNVSICNTSGGSSAEESALSTHKTTQTEVERYQRTQTEVESFKCGFCGKVFPQQSTLKRHQISHWTFQIKM